MMMMMGRKKEQWTTQFSFNDQISLSSMFLMNWCTEHQDATQCTWFEYLIIMKMQYQASLIKKNGPQHNRRTLLIPLNFLFLRLFVSLHDIDYILCFIVIIFWLWYHSITVWMHTYNMNNGGVSQSSNAFDIKLYFFFIKQQVPVYLLFLTLSRMLFNIQHRRT